MISTKIYNSIPITDIARGHFCCVLDGLTTMNKFSGPRIIRYSMPKHEKQIY